jgi:hypothetical protein
MESVTADSGPPTTPVLSTVLSVGCLLLAVILPAFAVYAGISRLEVLINGFNLKSPPPVESLTTFQHVAIAAIATIPALCQSYGLLSARRCFQSFARREYFTLPVIKGLRGFAAGMFLWPVAAILSKPLLTYLATLHAGPGGHEVSIGIGTEQVLTLLFAGILWQIAGVMTSAKRIAEENSQFV